MKLRFQPLIFIRIRLLKSGTLPSACETGLSLTGNPDIPTFREVDFSGPIQLAMGGSMADDLGV